MRFTNDFSKNPSETFFSSTSRQSPHHVVPCNMCYERIPYTSCKYRPSRLFITYRRGDELNGRKIICDLSFKAYQYLCNKCNEHIIKTEDKYCDEVILANDANSFKSFSNVYPDMVETFGFGQRMDKQHHPSIFASNGNDTWAKNGETRTYNIRKFFVINKTKNNNNNNNKYTTISK